jgi:hypothetical protein
VIAAESVGGVERRRIIGQVVLDLAYELTVMDKIKSVQRHVALFVSFERERGARLSCVSLCLSVAGAH